MHRLICFFSIFALAFCFLVKGFSAEHPGEHPGTPAVEHTEHPGKTHTEEHPGEEHPGMEEMLTGDAIRQGILGHIEEVTKAHDGYYPLHDDQEGTDLELKFKRVHDRVSYIKKDDAYFACADFETAGGEAGYDVDFWMKKGEDGELKVYKTIIHKKDGAKRFTYSDDEIVPVE